MGKNFKKLAKLSEKEKMLNGYPYDASDKQIRKLLCFCKFSSCMKSYFKENKNEIRRNWCQIWK